MTTDKVSRIQEITLQIKRLSSELAIITGMSGSSVKDVTANPDIIMDIVTDVFGVNPKIKSRKKAISTAKFAATFLLKRYTRLSLKDISIIQGGVEHSVVSFRILQARNLLDVDTDFQNKINECMVRIELLV